MKEKIKVKGQLGLYLQWPVILSVLLVIMNLIIGAVNLTAGLVMCGLTLIYIVIALWISADVSWRGLWSFPRSMPGSRRSCWRI